MKILALITLFIFTIGITIQYILTIQDPNSLSHLPTKWQKVFVLAIYGIGLFTWWLILFIIYPIG